MRGENPSSIEFKLAKNTILSKIHQELGIDQCKAFASGGAPISKKTIEFFMSLGIPLVESFGMSETTGPHTSGTDHMHAIGSVGPLSKYNQSKIINPGEDGCGELALYGRHIFMGYLNDEAKTAEAFDEHGW